MSGCVSASSSSTVTPHSSLALALGNLICGGEFPSWWAFSAWYLSPSFSVILNDSSVIQPLIAYKSLKRPEKGVSMMLRSAELTSIFARFFVSESPQSPNLSTISPTPGSLPGGTRSALRQQALHLYHFHYVHRPFSLCCSTVGPWAAVDPRTRTPGDGPRTGISGAPAKPRSFSFA